MLAYKENIFKRLTLDEDEVKCGVGVKEGEVEFKHSSDVLKGACDVSFDSAETEVGTATPPLSPSRISFGSRDWTSIEPFVNVGNLVFPPRPRILFHNSNAKVQQKEKNLSRSAKKTEAKQKVPKFKTEMCKNWMETNVCRYKKKCQFAHGKEELHIKPKANNKYKSQKCTVFFQKKTCPYGSRCLFKHDDRKLHQIKRNYYSLLLKAPEVREIRPQTRRLSAFKKLCDSKEC